MAEPERESDTELEQQLMEAGNKLLDPPSSVEEIITLLDKVESCLSRVEQSPGESMQNALAPSRKALVDERLFKHTDADVKVAVASCISEITRITAPDAPYGDDQMRDVFQHIVSCFGDLADNTSRSFNKRTIILETVAKVRSCVVMLDLECDALIIEMFQLFLNSIRDHHQESVFSSMEKIMSLVLEESEEISVELLSPLLASLRKDNKEVIPTAWKLGERVLENCAPKIKPYLTKAIKSLGISIVDYSDVVASICPEVPKTVEQNEGRAADENKIGAPSEEVPEAVKEIVVDASTEKQVEPANEDTPVTSVSNGVSQTQEVKSVDSNSSKKHGDEDGTEQPKDDDSPMKTESQNLDVEAAVDTKSKQELTSKKKENKVPGSKKPTEPTGSSGIDTEKGEQLPDIKTDVTDLAVLAEAAPPAEKKKEADAESSSPKDMEKESETIISPSLNEIVPEETLSKIGSSKKKGKKVHRSKKLTEPTGSSGVDTEKGEQLPDIKTDATDLSVPAEAAPPAEKKREADAESSLPKDMEKESETIISSSLSENVPEETLSKKGGRSKKKESSTKDSTASRDDASKKASEEDSESEGKPHKRHGKKVSGSTLGEDRISSHKDTPKKGRGTSSKSEEKQIKPPAKKEKLSSLKSGLKSMKDVQPAKETPTAALKRKHTPDSSSSKGYGQEVVGEKVKVWWPKDREFYEGKIESFDPEKGKHTVVYNDGDVEVLNLKRQRFEFIRSEAETDKEDAPAPDDLDMDAASDTPLKKKVRTSNDQSKNRASSSKSRNASSKSGQKVKEDVKPSKSEKDMPPTSSKIKIKIGSSKDKAKEDEDKEINTTASVEVEDASKPKVASSSKGRAGEATKSNKKRRKA